VKDKILYFYVRVSEKALECVSKNFPLLISTYAVLHDGAQTLEMPSFPTAVGTQPFTVPESSVTCSFYSTISAFCPHVSRCFCDQCLTVLSSNSLFPVTTVLRHSTVGMWSKPSCPNSSPYRHWLYLVLSSSFLKNQLHSPLGGFSHHLAQRH
jgi:hypothetical protein